MCRRPSVSVAKNHVPHRRNSDGWFAAPAHFERSGLLHGYKQHPRHRISLGLQRQSEKVLGIDYESISTSRWSHRIFFFSPKYFFPSSVMGHKKRFLINCRSGGVSTDVQIGSGATGTEVRTTLMTQDVVDMSIQAVLAMLYLHRHRVIHRDLSARNCV